jgi:hypothetical protein
MRMIIKIPGELTSEVQAIQETLSGLCESIHWKEKYVYCVPSGGHLLSIVQLLSKNGIQYEIRLHDAGLENL